MEIKLPNGTFIQPISSEDFAPRGLNWRRAGAAPEAGTGATGSSHRRTTPSRLAVLGQQREGSQLGQTLLYPAPPQKRGVTTAPLEVTSLSA